MRTLKTVLLGFLVAIAAWEVPAVAADVPFSLNFNGSAPNSVNSPFQPGTSTGAVSPFGPAIASLQFSYSGSTVSVKGTFTLSSGDSFSGTFSGTAAVNSSILPFSGNITGGTGIFAQATGSLQATLTFTNLSPTATTLKYTVTGSGTVSAQTSASALTVAPLSLSFYLAQGSGSSASQGLLLDNKGFSAIPFQAAATVTSSGPNWLSVDSASGSVAASTTSLLTVTANSQSLGAGIFNGQVAVTSSTGTLNLFVQLIVGPAGPNLHLSQTGMFFMAAAGAFPPPALTITVSNAGTGSLAGLTASASVLAKADANLAGINWLTATILPSSDPKRAEVRIAVDQTRLFSDKYYGRVDFALPGAVNSPQSLIVVMYVSGRDLGASTSPYYLEFLQGYPSFPASPQHLVITNLSQRPLTFSTRADYLPGGYSGGGIDLTGWLSPVPASGVVNPGSPVTLQISVLPQAANQDVNSRDYVAYLHVNIAETHQDLQGFMFYILAGKPLGSAAPTGAARAASAAGCAGTNLIPLFASLGAGFQATVAVPAPLQVAVFDSCGQTVDTGTVVATFSSGEPPLPLVSLGGGQWSATWVPRTAAAQVTITVQAVAAAFGTGTLSGSVAANTDTPVVNSGGVGSAANGVTTIAPGEFVTIYGSNLRTGAADAPSAAPYPASLDGIQVTLGGRVLPLAYSGSAQINAIVPYDIPPNTRQQLIVQTATAYSQPETVTIAATQPGVFTQDQSGTGPGAILVQKAGSSVSSLVTASNPASAGDALLIFCTGLATVSPAVAAGAATPASPLSNTDNQVTVTVGGQSAPVLFAGLAPAFVGLYQVNVTVPKGIAPAANVPLVMTVADADSVPVTVAIK